MWPGGMRRGGDEDKTHGRGEEHGRLETALAERFQEAGLGARLEHLLAYLQACRGALSSR